MPKDSVGRESGQDAVGTEFTEFGFRGKGQRPHLTKKLGVIRFNHQ